MGCEPTHLTGYAPLAESARFEQVWGATVPATPGLDAIAMLDAAASGELRALWVVGWDLLQTQPNMTATAEALTRLDLLIVQDLFLNETARQHANVFLPACSSFEKDGTFMNGERRIQRVRRAIEPSGNTRADWEIACMAARAMGKQDLFDFAGLEEVWDEVRRVWPGGAGMTYDRLDTPGGLQWPCPTSDHPGTAILHADSFGTATLAMVDYLPSPGLPDDDHPFLLITGRALHQFNAGTMTRRSVTQQLRPTDTLEISDRDADRLSIADGDPVRLTSPYGSSVLPAGRSDRVRPGQLFATFSDPVSAVNQLTGPRRDPETNTPEYKITAVVLTAELPGPRPPDPRPPK